ncbi:MAG: hypothetical protein NWQ55_13725 [Salibacteraceae bacterium]|nr:hypothetical protein [Salibacteraceae bacterium]
MNYNEAAKMLVEKGFYDTKIKAFDAEPIRAALAEFMNRPIAERLPFLQKQIDSVFDGYSFQGQTDSLNQGADDLVYTFVLSEFTEASKFPVEFQSFLNQEFKAISKSLSKLEKHLEKELQLPINHAQVGHMVSCNFYPAQGENVHPLLLSEHPDVSLFTIFPFGVDAQLEYEGHGIWKSFPASDTMVILSGFFAETISEGRIKALNHRVKARAKNNLERFSFAFFSIPAPKQKFTHLNETFFTEDYFKSYIALF